MSKGMPNTTLPSRFNPYSDYKDSGVEWLGEIPAHWEVMRFGFNANFIVPMRDKPAGLSGPIPWIRIEDFDGRYIAVSKSGQGVSNETVRHMNLKIFPSGTVLCSCSCDMGATAIVERPLISNQTFIGIVPHARMKSEYIYYLMQVAKQHLTALATGAIQQYLSRNDFSSLRMPVFLLGEQSAIAAFLDRETAKIDSMVAKKERLIELLQEKRTALIAHAVTKGIDPNVPMKDSGVERLGKIPTHWEVKRYKRITKRVDVGIAEAATHAYADQGVPIIRSTNVRQNHVELDDMFYIEEWFANKNRSKFLHTGDVVTVRTGNAGVSAVVPPSLNRSQCFTLLISTPSARQVSQFYSYYLNAKPAQTMFAIEGLGTAQINISVPILQNIFVVEPPHEEQQQIVAFLERETAKIDALVAKVREGIEKLKEYRIALISAAVTGKIDVREESA